jgi:hypothetical protein
MTRQKLPDLRLVLNLAAHGTREAGIVTSNLTLD